MTCYAEGCNKDVHLTLIVERSNSSILAVTTKKTSKTIHIFSLCGKTSGPFLLSLLDFNPDKDK